jgi:hypothetical protein
MRTLLKIAVLVCFLLTLAYSAIPLPVKGKEVPPAPKREMAHGRVLQPKENPGEPLASIPTATAQLACLGAMENSLPLPTSVAPSHFVDFEKQILSYLQSGEYKELNWCVDKGVRDTGPSFQGTYYGTHPAVRVFYSPKVMQWLIGGRTGSIPDGAMIIKEQYPPSARLYAGLPDGQLPKVTDWTVMIRDSKGSKDGWFWGEFFDAMKFDDDEAPFQYPWAGFGLYCLRCHSSAETELTFSALNNIKGFPGQPLSFPDDGSVHPDTAEDANHRHLALTPLVPGRQANADFLQTFNSIANVPFAEVQKMPSETYDNIVTPGTGPGQFVNSNYCMSCHGALSGLPFGPVMFLPSESGSGANVSPYGEWRWSPMGLAGRDPIFYAQLESEFAFLQTLPPPANEQAITGARNTCLSCHGVMGKRELDIESGGNSGDFLLDYLQITDRSDPHFKYGALARDGISCAVCHRIQEDQYPPGVPPLQYFLEHSITGAFDAAPRDRINGPFMDDLISPQPMENGTGIKPRFERYIASSRMCGSCHVIDVPVVDGQPGQRSIEQATYLEWLNSQYQNEFGTPGPNARSCQDCHMPGSYHSESKGISIDQLQQKIAITQDETYPEAEFDLPHDKTIVRTRTEGYARHELLGLNVTLLEMFRQFWDVLGVRKEDYMSGSTTDLQDSIDNFVQQAQERTARVEVTSSAAASNQMVADVTVTNLTGHRFPTGVGFRRLIIELVVQDAQQRVVWASGRTNDLGVIVDGNGSVLPTEFFMQSGGKQQYQPHYEVITAQNQVQIYEELTQNADGVFTTNFLRRDHNLKDNRLLPIGWTSNGPDPSLNGRFLASTHPEGDDVIKDPDYENGQGKDHVSYQITLPAGVDPTQCTVKATLYYQSTPPYYLSDRFRAVPDGEATKRLYYLTSNLNLTDRPTEKWKLKIVSTEAVPVTGGVPGACVVLCFRGPLFYLSALDRLPRGSVTVAGSNFNQAISTSDRIAMKLALTGTNTLSDRFNREFVAVQLTLLALPGQDAAALQSQLGCYGLSLAPVRLRNGTVLNSRSTLAELLYQSRNAALQNSAGDMAVLAKLLGDLNSDDPRGTCGSHAAP